MSRLKTFGKYLLMFVAFYIFVTVASIGFIKGTYETMEQNVYSSDEIQIEVDEAKSTFVNGYVKGKLTNNSDSDIHSKYVKINFLSKKGNVILTKYLDIDELKAKETKNFTINFEAENIKSFNMSIVDEYIQEKSNAQLINLSDAENEEIKNISIFLSAITIINGKIKAERTGNKVNLTFILFFISIYIKCSKRFEIY